MTQADFLTSDFPAPRSLPDGPPVGPARFFNRELSWLAFNQRVLDERRRPTFGPTAPPLAPTVDVEQMVAAWRRLREERALSPEPEEAQVPPPSRRRWWRRLRGR